jgi:NADH-quinone oxidoreductase subunit H
MTADLLALFIVPGGLFVLLSGLAFEWVDRKLVARLQNRVGPRWFQPVADVVKLLAKDEVVPRGVSALVFNALPGVGLASVLTAALYVPLAGLAPAFGFQGDLVVTVYLLGALSLCLSLAGATTNDRFSLLGAGRTLTQLFCYEAPWLLSLLGPAMAASSWQIGDVAAYATSHWLVLTQPVGFVVAVVGLAGKLELAPLDAPEAETELVAGALTEYGGRGLALFRLAKDAALVVGLALIAAFYLGGVGPYGPVAWLAKTLVLLGLVALLQTLFARLRIDQTVGLWWRFGAWLALLQLLALGLWKVVVG